MMRARHGLILGLVLGVTACGEFPELEGQISDEARAAPYPDLVPIESLRAGIPEPRITETTGSDVASRVDALQRRADALRGPVIPRPTRVRMTNGVPR